jgi:glycosyltransferase involved in cell wall biosynthesis
MNILLINHYAGSDYYGMEYRPYYFASEWKKMGHHTTIVAATHSHIRSHNPEIKGWYCIEEHQGIEYFWIKTPSYKSNSPARFINMLIFIFRLFLLVPKICKRIKYDAVIASSTYPLDIFPSRKIAKRCKAKLVYEVHDLWPLSPMELGGYSKYHPFIMIMQYAENYAYNHVDYVVSLLPKTKEHMIAHGLKEEKWSYIPNGINLNDWQQRQEIPADIKNELLLLKNKFRRMVAYTGTYGVANALDSLLDASKLLVENSVAVVLFGKGPEYEHLCQRVKTEELKNVFVFGSIAKRSIPDLLSVFDFLYIGWRNQHNLYRFGISPNKLMDYMMSGKPVIHAVKAGNDLVVEAGCGISVTPENAVEIAKAIKELSSKTDETLKVMGDSGRKFIMSEHLNSVLAAKFIKILNS